MHAFEILECLSFVQISAIITIAGELHEAAEANVKVKQFFVEWANEPALEFDETLAIPTCDNALPIRPLYCYDGEATDSHILEVLSLEQRLVPRLHAQEAQLQQMIRVSLLLNALIRVNLKKSLYSIRCICTLSLSGIV